MKTLFLLPVLLAASLALANQPECTGDRHYDGVGCCPVTTTTVDPTTTTTLPSGECPVGCISDSDIPPCPVVNVPPCPADTDGSDGPSHVSVTVLRCAAAPNYVPCRLASTLSPRHLKFLLKHNRVLVPTPQGPVVCAKPGYKGRVLAPMPVLPTP